jgi:hypothetical protein
MPETATVVDTPNALPPDIAAARPTIKPIWKTANAILE